MPMIADPVLVNTWHPVASVRQLETQSVLAARLLGEELVLWQADSQVLAWRDLCLHRGTRLSLGRVAGETILCPYHGWSYGPDGRCVHIPAHPGQAPPAKAQATTYRATVAYDLVWVCLGEPREDVPPFHEWHDPSYRKILCGPYHLAAAGPRIVENFLDVGHFPFVHEGILGGPAYPEISDYTATITADGVLADRVRVYQPDPYGTGQGDWVGYVYQVLRPLTARFHKASGDQGFAITLFVTPHDATTSSAWMCMAMNYGHDLPEAELVAYQDRIFAQDKPIVESQRPELLPLDLQAELHLRSDRAAIAYRQWLRALGLTYGVS
jgi:phenylpropionate dioxygenase-like ring-hydroxylating dioxygenase large terminal subunit